MSDQRKFKKKLLYTTGAIPPQTITTIDIAIIIASRNDSYSTVTYHRYYRYDTYYNTFIMKKQLLK